MIGFLEKLRPKNGSYRVRMEYVEVQESVFTRENILPLLLKNSCDLSGKDKQQIINFYFSVGKQQFEKLCVANKVLPFAAHILVCLGIDREYWISKHDLFLTRNIKILTSVVNVFEKFEENGIKSAVLCENFAVLLSSEECLGCFCSGDVDIYADISERNLIISVMNDLGFKMPAPIVQMSEYAGQSIQFVNYELLSQEFWVNIIWVPVTRAFLYQDRYKKRLQLERSRCEKYKSSSIKLFDKTALLYFCCLHIAAGHYYSLSPGVRLYYDVDRLVRSREINWDKIEEWQREDVVGFRVAVVLYLSKILLNAPVPDFSYRRAISKMKIKCLVRYLVDPKSKHLQSKNSLLRRLWIEVVSESAFVPLALIRLLYRVVNRSLKCAFSKTDVRRSF